MGTPGPDVAVLGVQDSQILLGAQASEESQGLHGELAVLQGCRHVCGGVPAMGRKGLSDAGEARRAVCGRSGQPGLRRRTGARTHTTAAPASI
jgi:hypothetical protein